MAQLESERYRRWTGIAALAVIVLSIVGTLLIVSPEGTPLRQQARSALVPYFSQNWRVFAPSILKANRTLEIRAQWREDGELVHSDWVSITGIELRAVSGNLAPSRVEKSSWNASNIYLQRYFRLDETQRRRVQDTFIERDGDGFRPISDTDLIAQLGPGDPDVIRFLRMDYMFMRYATLFATAGFGREIERVQWRIVRDRPNDFDNRFVDEKQFPTRITTFGWRQSNVRIDPDVVDAYRGVIERHGARWKFREAMPR